MNGEAERYGTAKRQRELLEMMKDVDLLFREHGIQYALIGGTLLGAVRENGFIPWDDDIDLLLNRENFEKAMALFADRDKTGPYGLRREVWVERIHFRDSKDPNDAAIDLFVLDRVPDGWLARMVKLLTIRTLQGMIKPATVLPDQSLFYRMCLKVTHWMGKLFSQERKYRWYRAVSRWGEGKKTRNTAMYNDLFHLVSLRYSGTLMDRTEMHVFEDTEFPIPVEYDNYLSVQYGDDYMIPPPESERVPIHL